MQNKDRRKERVLDQSTNPECIFKIAVTFLSRLQVALFSVGYTNIELKVKQVIRLVVLYLDKSLVAVLPTGKRKSRINAFPVKLVLTKNPWMNPTLDLFFLKSPKL